MRTRKFNQISRKGTQIIWDLADRRAESLVGALPFGRFCTAFVAIVFFATNCLWAHKPQISVWSERQKSLELRKEQKDPTLIARLPSGTSDLPAVLKSKRAISANVQIMRIFNRMREALLSYKELQSKITETEKKYDKNFAVVFHAIRRLLDGPEKPVQIKGFNR